MFFVGDGLVDVLADLGDEAGGEADLVVVLGDGRFQVEGVDVGGGAGAVAPAAAEEVEVGGAVAVLDLLQRQALDDAVSLAVAAVEGAFEVVVVDAAAFAGDGAAFQDVLDVVEGVVVDEGFVAALDLLVVYLDVAEVVAVAEHGRELVERHALGGSLGRRPGAQAAVVEFVVQLSQGPVAGGVQLEREPDQGSALGVDGDGADLLAVEEAADIEVAQRGATDENPGLEESRHPYAYAGNDPLNQTDPRGLLAQLSAAAQAGLGASGAFATMAPAGQRQNTALETVAASVGLASYAYGPGGDRTTPHNQARDTAKLALGIEMMKQYGPGALSRMRTEVEVPHGAKRHRYPGVPVPPANARSGRIDILFQETAQRVAIWEVKSALTREAREFANGKADVVHYIGRYQQAFPGQQAAGIPMPIPYPVLLRTDHQVYSPYGNHDGVVMYRKWPAGQPPPTTVPERVPERVPEPRREPRWWEFWKWDWDWPWEWDIDWGKVLGGLLAGLAIAAVIAAIIVSLPALAVAAAVVGLLSLIPLPEYPDPNDPRNLA